jgi:SAM-dependent methyltransferase
MQACHTRNRRGERVTTPTTAPATRHSTPNPLRLIWDLLRQRSLLRAWFSAALSRLNHTLSGTVVDLGSKHPVNHYHACFRVEAGTKMIATDLNAGPGVVQVDVERPLPFEDGSIDSVLAFHLFEHVYDLDRIAPECQRILKPGGRVYLSLPFLYEFHADPWDYWRFTDRAIVRWWSEAGFEVERIEALGDGPFTALATRIPALMLPPVPGLRGLAGALAYMLALPLDLLMKIRPMRKARSIPFAYAQGWLAVLCKPQHAP